MVVTMKSAVRESSTTRIFFLLIRSSLLGSSTAPLHDGEGEVGEIGQGLGLAEDGGRAQGARLRLHVRGHVCAQHDDARPVIAPADLAQQLQASRAPETGHAN